MRRGRRTQRKAKVAGGRGGPALQLKTKIWEDRARVQTGSARSSHDRESRRPRRNRRGAFNILRAIHAWQIREVTRALALEVGIIASRRKKRINETDRPVTSPCFTCLPTVARCRRPNLLRVKRGIVSNVYAWVVFEILSRKHSCEVAQNNLSMIYNWTWHFFKINLNKFMHR